MNYRAILGSPWIIFQMQKVCRSWTINLMSHLIIFKWHFLSTLRSCLSVVVQLILQVNVKICFKLQLSLISSFLKIEYEWNVMFKLYALFSMQIHFYSELEFLERPLNYFFVIMIIFYLNWKMLNFKIKTDKINCFRNGENKIVRLGNTHCLYAYVKRSLKILLELRCKLA